MNGQRLERTQAKQNERETHENRTHGRIVMKHLAILFLPQKKGPTA